MSAARFAIIRAAAEIYAARRPSSARNAASRAAPAVTGAWIAGMIGELVFGAGAETLLSDITSLAIPGLAALGIQASISTIPTEVDDAVRDMRAATSRGRPAIALSVQSIVANEPALDAEYPIAADGQVIEARLVTGSELTVPDGETSRELSSEESPRGFTHILTFARSTVRGRKRQNAAAALLRWCAFDAAYPDRTAGDEFEDAQIREKARLFLQEACGNRRDPAANCLRRAAAKYADADIGAAILWIKKAALREIYLPAAACVALLTPAEERLSSTARREVIYLARAGTHELKVMAARRLAAESDSADANSTLAQLASDPDPWVRSAARAYPCTA